MSAVNATVIEAALRACLGEIDALEVVNESHLHAGHAGAGEGSHWRVRIVSARMAGLARPARHRLVYDALSALMPQGIHALAIEARSPAET
jgi:BolA family transcriptional regulator, general stress-responsive regulator